MNVSSKMGSGRQGTIFVWNRFLRKLIATLMCSSGGQFTKSKNAFPYVIVHDRYLLEGSKSAPYIAFLLLGATCILGVESETDSEPLPEMLPAPRLFTGRSEIISFRIPSCFSLSIT
jgi:hypothetical protein